LFAISGGKGLILISSFEAFPPIFSGFISYTARKQNITPPRPDPDRIIPEVIPSFPG
jgi:hypothetical protein